MSRSTFNSIATMLIATGLAAVMGCSSSDDPTPSSDASAEGGAASDDSGSDAGAEASTDAPTETSTTDAGLQSLQARGKYLVETVIGCSDCHTPQGAMGPDMTKFLAGNADFATGPNGDKLPTRNLTNDETGLKNRTDAEIKKMFLEGVRPTATGEEALNPVMPYYVLHNMTAGDADAIVAYLRTVPGVMNSIPQRGAFFDVPAAARPLDVAAIPAPAADFPARESALRGKYLATQSGLCIECHTVHQHGVDELDTTKFFQGGEDFSPFFATSLMIKPVSANLTSDVATGLGSWSTADILKVLKEGKDKEGNGICPPMPIALYAHLTTEDATDIANYIKSLPPATNAVADVCSFPPAPPGDGGMSEAATSDAGTHEAGNSEASASDAAPDSAATDAAAE